jgi:hypothetical protein
MVWGGGAGSFVMLDLVTMPTTDQVHFRYVKINLVLSL